MNERKLQEYKKLLEQQEKSLRKDLESRGRKILNGEKPDWIGMPNKDDDGVATSADANENADDIEDFETNIAIVSELEEQYREVIDALRRIEDGSYGICSVSGAPIEEDRLRAVPTARTCKKYIK